MKPTVLITRAQEHVAATQKDVAALGYDTAVDSMLEIHPIADTTPLSASTSALIVTSRNALQGIKTLENANQLPMFIVGKETAKLFADAGFTNICGVVEQSADLPKMIIAGLSPNAGVLLHVTSQHAHTDFYDALLDANFGIDQRLVYSADAATQFNPATITALQRGTLAGVVFYSARTAEIFNGLVAAADLAGALSKLRAFCLSDAVAGALDKPKWKAVLVAKSPTHAAMMETLRDCLAKGV